MKIREQSGKPQVLVELLQPWAFMCSECNSPLLWLFQVGSLLCYDTTKPNSHGGRFPSDSGADSLMGHVQSHQRPGNDLLCVLSLIGEAVVVKLESGHSTYKPFSLPTASSKGNKHPSCHPQIEAGIFLSLCLLNPENRELDSYITFKNHSELHLFAKP